MLNEKVEVKVDTLMDQLVSVWPHPRLVVSR